MHTLLPSQTGEVLALDELWSFVPSKAQTLWLRVALCRRTRQIVAWTLGDRSQQSAADLRASLPKDDRERAEAYSFSKHRENHLDAIHFFITPDNLAINPSTSV